MAINLVEFLHGFTERELKSLKESVHTKMFLLKESETLFETYKEKELKVLKSIEFKLQEQNINIIKGLKMEFDVNRVYTAVNADELKVRSKVVLANSLHDLKEKVAENYIYILDSVEPEKYPYRFKGIGSSTFLFAYLVEDPKEPSYRAYKDGDEAFMYLHDKWLERKIDHARCKITVFHEYYVSLDNQVPDFDCLLSDWEIYSETGRNEPCGVEEE